jgi:hypothetical protein
MPDDWLGCADMRDTTKSLQLIKIMLVKLQACTIIQI